MITSKKVDVYTYEQFLGFLKCSHEIFGAPYIVLWIIRFLLNLDTCSRFDTSNCPGGLTHFPRACDERTQFLWRNSEQ